MVDLLDRVAIVTGAGQGMGRAHAEELAAQGAAVVVNDAIAEYAEQTVQAIIAHGGRASVSVHDVSCEAAQIVHGAIAEYGRLDIVVANAGILRVASFAEQDADEFWRVFDVSFKGTVDLVRAAWTHLTKSNAARLILISSSGLLANPGASAYGAAKGAIWALGNTLAAEGERVGIQVNTLMPTAWTPMTTSAFDDPAIVKAFRDAMGAEHVAAFVAFLADPGTAISGEFFQVSGGQAGRLVLAGQKRVVAPESTPQGWAHVADALTADGELVTAYRSSGEQFVAEMVALDPSVEEAFARIDPPDLSRTSSNENIKHATRSYQ